jgi:hypothetical protein
MVVLADVDIRLIDNSGNRSAVWKFYSYQPVIRERPRRDRTLKAWIQFEVGRCLVLRLAVTFSRHGLPQPLSVGIVFIVSGIKKPYYAITSALTSSTHNCSEGVDALKCHQYTELGSNRTPAGANP